MTRECGVRWESVFLGSVAAAAAAVGPSVVLPEEGGWLALKECYGNQIEYIVIAVVLQGTPRQQREGALLAYERAVQCDDREV